MNVQGLGHTNHAESRSANSSKAKVLKSGGSKAVFSIADKVELTSTSTDRNEFIQQVKNKVKTGYYATESVMEDLSHGFAKILNQM
jgi:hypothetical protein